MRLLLVGRPHGVHIAGSLQRAAAVLGLTSQLLDVEAARSHSRWLNALWWRLDRRPFRLARFGQQVAAHCRQWRPDLLLCTGQTPLDRHAHDALDALAIRRHVWLTDDPFNPAHRARWFLETLPRYDTIFSPRTANFQDLKNAGAQQLVHLPFAYDPDLYPAELPEPESSATVDILFVGAADADRAPILRLLAAQGFSLALYGGYWSRYGLPASAVRGVADFAEIRRATRQARISLCLVRRANRDGHVMRSYEIPACGGVPLVEDTAEHRLLFGPEGEAALYFATEAQLVEKAHRLLRDEPLRQQLATAARARIAIPQNTYTQRLRALID